MLDLVSKRLSADALDELMGGLLLLPVEERRWWSISVPEGREEYEDTETSLLCMPPSIEERRLPPTDPFLHALLRKFRFLGERESEEEEDMVDADVVRSRERLVLVIVELWNMCKY